MTAKLTELKDRISYEKLRLTLERRKGETYSGPGPALYGYGSYPRSSVLAGRTKRVFLSSWESHKEALADLKEMGVKFTDDFASGMSGHVPVEEVISHIPKNDYDEETEAWERVARDHR